MYRKYILITIILMISATQIGAEEKNQQIDKLFKIIIDTNSLKEKKYAIKKITYQDENALSYLNHILKNNEYSNKEKYWAVKIISEIKNEKSIPILLISALDSDYLLAQESQNALIEIYANINENILIKKISQIKTIDNDEYKKNEQYEIINTLYKQKKNQALYKKILLKALHKQYNQKKEFFPYQKIIEKYLNDDDWQLRYAALELAEINKSKEITAQIARMLVIENNTQVLIKALQTMAKIKPEEYGEIVERQTENNSQRVALEATATLYAMGYEQALVSNNEVLKNKSVAGYLFNPSNVIRKRALEILAETRQPIVFKYIIEKINDKNTDIRILAIKYIANEKNSAAIGNIKKLLNDKNINIRLEAIKALNKMDVIGTEKYLENELEEAKNSQDIEKIIDAIGNIKNYQNIEKIEKYMYSNDIDLACKTIEVIAKINNKKNGKIIYDIMKNNDNIAINATCRDVLYSLFKDDPGETKSSWSSWEKRNRKDLGNE